MPPSAPSVKAVFDRALEIASPADREAYLDAACAGAPEVRQQVEALLRAYAEAGSFLEPPSPGPADATAAYGPGDADATRTSAADPEATAAPARHPGPAATARDLGTVIAGRYTLIEVIGEGGMGSVYLASQTEPVKRQVALKLIKTGMDSKGVLARFDAERQALAMMDHPNIARIYDGGVTTSGQPFFVMELVQGVPLTEYCDAKRLTVDARLQLFVQVCNAVQHAHQKGIIHRDLKPANVLVTEVDGRPTPKVIDFGVAKATEQKLTDLSFSDTGAIVGTPAYMSPEQADPSSMDIDTRTDVYALGVMLYELLTGSPPIDSKQFKRGAILEILRMVREVEPPRPSTKLSTADALPNIAANRNIEPAKLAKLLQGELDWVVMKALEKDRTRRYETANGLARDIQRYLADEVVEARPPSAGYRFKKFVKRNPLQLTLAGLVAALLLGGVSVVWWQLNQAGERREADLRRQLEDQQRAADEAQRQARTVAGIAAALDDARRRCEEGWELTNDPPRMQIVATFAEAATKRAEELVATGMSDAAVRTEVTTVRAEVNDLARHARLLTGADLVGVSHPDGPVSGSVRSRVERRHQLAAAFREFGLDPLAQPVPEAARAILGSRARDKLLGHLATWQYWAGSEPDEAKRAAEVGRVGEVIRVVRLEAGGVLARWQECLDRGDMEGIAGLSADPAVLELGPQLIAEFTRDITGAKRFREALALARRACDRYPAHVALRWNMMARCGALDPPLLGEALQHATAMAVLHPDRPFSHNALGWKQRQTGQPGAAVRSFMRAVELNPAFDKAQEHLGYILASADESAGVDPADLEVIRTDPRFARTHVHHGLVLSRLPDPDGATTAYRLALKLDPKLVPAHLALGSLRETWFGDMEGAAAEYEKAARLDPSDRVAAAVLARVKRLRGLLDRLPGILDRTERVTTADLLDLADLCVNPGQRKYAAAARLWANAFAADPKLGDDFKTQHRYNAACSAALAAAGQGKEEPPLDDTAKAKLRREALGWLKAELNAWEQLLNSGPPQARASVLETFSHWQKDADLAGIRDRDALAKLPAEEQKTFTQLWSDVARLRQEASARHLAFLQEQLSAARKQLAADSPQMAGLLAQIAMGLLEQKKWADAEPLLRESLGIREKAQPDVWSTFNTQSLLGGALLGQKKYADAEPLLVKGYEGMKAREKTIPQNGGGELRIPEALDRLIELYTATKKPDEAKKWRAERAKFPTPKEVAPPPPEKK